MCTHGLVHVYTNMPVILNLIGCICSFMQYFYHGRYYWKWAELAYDVNSNHFPLQFQRIFQIVNKHLLIQRSWNYFHPIFIYISFSLYSHMSLYINIHGWPRFQENYFVNRNKTSFARLVQMLILHSRQMCMILSKNIFSFQFHARLRSNHLENGVVNSLKSID